MLCSASTVQEQDSTPGQQDTVTDQDSTPGQQHTVTDQDSTTTEQIIPTSGQRRRRRGVSQVRDTHTHTHTHTEALTLCSTHALLVQALRNLVNVSGQRIQQLFNALDRRLKSADKKDQSGVRGQEGDGVQKKHKTRTQRTS